MKRPDPRRDFDDVPKSKKYGSTLPGIARLLIVLCHLAGWITAICIPKSSAYMNMSPHFEVVRACYMAFAILGFIFSLLVYLYFLFNIGDNRPFLKFGIWNYVLIIGLNIFAFVPTLVLSIFCIIKEIDYQNNKNSAYYVLVWGQYGINDGTFLAAGILGLVCSLLYIIDTLFQAVAIIKNQ